MKIAIIGSRKYENLTNVTNYVKQLPSDTIVISGGAQGVDYLAAKAARARNLRVTEYHPDFTKGYFPHKYLERNQLIAQDADAVIAFWDGHSRGTLWTIQHAKQLGKPTEIVEDQPNLIT